MAATTLFCRCSRAPPRSIGAMSGLFAIRLVRHWKTRASPEPFAPPAGSRIAATSGSVVGLPSAASAQSAGIGTRLSLATLSFPPAATLVAMSRVIGRWRPVGNEKAMGLLWSPAAFAPNGAMLGGLATIAIPAIPSAAAISE